MAPKNTKKTKICTRGFTCGASCISKAKICRSNIGADGKKIAESYADFVKRFAAEQVAAGGGGGGSDSPQLEAGVTKAGIAAEEEIRRQVRENELDEETASDLLSAIEAERYDRFMENPEIARRWEQSLSKEEANQQSQALRDRIESTGAQSAQEMRDLVANSGEPQPTRDNYRVNYFMDVEDFSTPEILTLLANEGGQRINAEALALVNELANGTVVDVSWDWEDNDDDRVERDFQAGTTGELGEKEALRVALSARRYWKENYEGKMPPGTILKNAPIGGPAGTRASGYARQGFGEVSPTTGEQFAIIGADGKARPLNTVLMDPSKSEGMSTDGLLVPRDRTQTFFTDETEDALAAMFMSDDQQDSFASQLESLGFGDDSDDFFAASPVFDDEPDDVGGLIDQLDSGDFSGLFG